MKGGSGFEFWLMKFDGVSGNKDKELEDPKEYGAIEHAYYRMAVDAGITMRPSRGADLTLQCPLPFNQG